MSAALERRGALTDEVEWLRRMLEIRLVEDRLKELFGEGEVRGTTHTAQGQEAVAVGIAAAIRASDPVTCTYRGHGHALALGMTLAAVIGEVMGRVTGCVGGVGGSMHLCDRSIGLMPTFAIVGAGIPIAAGAALASQVRGGDDVAVGIFGDGASNIGAFHEGLNLAAIWALPVVFVCENNVYGEYTRIDRTTPIADIADRGAAYGMPSAIVDGMNARAVRDAVADAVERARAGGGPALLEMKTYRYSGHSRSDAATYRPQGELEAWLERDPIDAFAAHLSAEGRITSDDVAVMRSELADQIDAAVEATRLADHPTIGAMFEHVTGGSA